MVGRMRVEDVRRHEEDRTMKIIKVSSDGRYTHHGIGYTEHDGYQGTVTNRLALNRAVTFQESMISVGEQYQIEINGISKGIFTKAA